nr:hypothetical protein [Sinomicrobium oceani]
MCKKHLPRITLRKSGVRQGRYGYQVRKKSRTTNALYLTVRQGLPLAISGPMVSNHNDLYVIEVHFEEVVGTLVQAYISVDGLFINTDTGFDS